MGTSLMILGWCLCFSIFSCYFFIARDLRDDSRLVKEPSIKQTSPILLPTLLIAPIAIFISYKLFRYSLIYPVFLDMSTFEIVARGLIPAGVLFIASGLFAQIRKKTRLELEYWQNKPCVLAGAAFGFTPRRVLTKLILIKTLSDSWTATLPWLMGELIVVEAVFSAPGLGLDAWHLAKQRLVSDFVMIVVCIGSVYIVLTYITHQVHQWLGRKLESYS